MNFCSSRGGRQYADEIRACESLLELRRLHAAAAAAASTPSRYVCNLLVHKYGKLGSVEEARRVFDATPDKNLYSWNIAMAAFAHNGHFRESLQLRHYMDSDGTKPDNFTFVSMLSSCAALRDLALGTALHARAADAGLESHPLVSNVLIFLYGRCGHVEKAKEIFDAQRQQQHSTVDSWNAILTAFAQNGDLQKALELYEQMQDEGIVPNKITLVCFLDAAAASAMAELGNRFHQEAVKCGLEHDPVVATALVTMYGRCGRLAQATRIFDAAEVKGAFMWNAMIAAFAQNGQYREALQLYSCPAEACAADEITFLCVLDACSGIGDIQLARELHSAIASRGFDRNFTVANALLTAYAKCGSLSDAKLIFDRLEFKNIVSWNAFLAAHSNNDRCRDALELWRRMDLEGVQSNVVTLITVANACSRLGDLAEGKRAHERVISAGLQGDLITCNGLITMYGYCNDPEAAKLVFDSMKNRNVVSWSAMIAANAQNGHLQEALDLYNEMDVEPDEIAFVTVLDVCSRMQSLKMGKQVHTRIVESGTEADGALGNALLTMYCRCSSVQDALQVFDNMKKRNAASWSAMAAAFAQNGHSLQALELYSRSLELGIEPDDTLLATALDSCSSMGDLEQGKEIHLRITSSSSSSSRDDALVGNALLSMYGKCGSIEAAQEAFQAIGHKNVISWNAMITAYARHGHGRGAVESFQSMDLEGVTPNVTTFSAVLVACSHSGLLEEGWTYFRYMTTELGIAADAQHYGCMLDLLCRLGQHADAREFLDLIPPGSVQWKNFLDYGSVARVA